VTQFEPLLETLPAGPAGQLASARRVLVIGSPGSGKSWLAQRLGARLDLPVHHLDDVYFTAQWGVRAEAEWDTLVDGLCAEPSWVVDGNFPRSFARRLDRADAVVVLDRHPLPCLGGFVRRILGYLVAPYESLPEHMRLPGGRRRVSARPLRFAVFILRFRRRTLPGMLEAARSRPQLPVVRLRSRGEVAALLDRLA
jgi:hypothetical protein